MTNQSPTTDPKDSMLPVGELRRKVIDIIQARTKFIVGQAKYVFDGRTEPQKADENNIFLNRKAADEILALFTAATNEKLAGGGDELDATILAEISRLHSFIWDDAKNPSLKSQKLDVINSADRQIVAKIEQLLNTAKQTAVAEAIPTFSEMPAGYNADKMEGFRDACLLMQKKSEMRNVLEGKS